MRKQNKKQNHVGKWIRFPAQWKQMLHVNYDIFTLKVIFLFSFSFECFSYLLYLKIVNPNGYLARYRSEFKMTRFSLG